MTENIGYWILEQFSFTPMGKPIVAVRIDANTLKWFQSQGEEAENQMAIALRIYA